MKMKMITTDSRNLYDWIYIYVIKKKEKKKQKRGEKICRLSFKCKFFNFVSVQIRAYLRVYIKKDRKERQR